MLAHCFLRFFLIIVLLMRMPCRYAYMIYATLCIFVFRIAWYGLNYPQIIILYFVPFVLFADYLMKKIANLFRLFRWFRCCFRLLFQLIMKK